MFLNRRNKTTTIISNTNKANARNSNTARANNGRDRGN